MRYFKLFFTFIILFFCLFFQVNAEEKRLPNTPDFSSKRDIHIIYNTGKNDKICGITLLFKWGVADEESYIQGLRSFIAELIYKQIEDIKTDEGITALEAYGIGIKTEVESDYILFKSSCMKEDFPFVLEKICEAVSNPFKDEKLFEKAKEDYVKKYKDQNGVISDVYSLFLTEFYKYHPYRHINSYSVRNIEKLNFKQAQDFLSKLLKRDKIYISASGRFNQEKADKIINKYFKNFGLSEIKPEDIQWDIGNEEKQKFLTASSPNGYLVIGYPAPSYSSSDYFTMLVANNLTGNGFGSRFWREIREKNGMAYGLGGVFPALEGPNHVMFYVMINPKNAMKVRKLAIDSINDLKSNGFSDEELKTAKEKAIGTLLLERESSSGFTSQKASSFALGLSPAIDEINQIKKVKKEDVAKVMNKYFKNPTVIIVRPPGFYLQDTWL